jgi:hypothetical protein
MHYRLRYLLDGVVQNYSHLLTGCKRIIFDYLAKTNLTLELNYVFKMK